MEPHLHRLQHPNLVLPVQVKVGNLKIASNRQQYLSKMPHNGYGLEQLF